MTGPENRGITSCKQLSVILLLVGFLMNSFDASAQWKEIPITLQMNDSPIIEILDSISSITNLNFSYNTEIIPEKRIRSLNVINLPLQKCLDTLFSDKHLRYVMVDRNIVIIKDSGGDRESKNLTAAYIYLRGKVIDEKSSKPLSFATIVLSGTHEGTIANEEGEFLMKILPDSTQREIMVSYIGYQNRTVVFNSDSPDFLTIKLIPLVISLQEIVIRYRDPATILDEAISRIAENYLSEYTAMNAYYREIIRRNSKVTVFSEAVLEIAKEPYSKSSKIERAKIIKGRKSIDLNAEDTIFMKIKSGVNSCLQLDIAKNLPDFMAEGYRELYSYRMADIVSYRDRLVYVIAFRQKDYIETALYQGELYLDMQNLAILAADFQLNPHYISQEKDLFIVSKKRTIQTRPLSAIYHVEYRDGPDGYHLNQVRGEVRFRMRKRRQWLSSAYSLSIEMAITDVNPGIKKRIRLNEQLPSGTILSEQKFDDDPAFWGGYNTIAPESSLEEVLEKMDIVR